MFVASKAVCIYLPNNAVPVRSLAFPIFGLWTILKTRGGRRIIMCLKILHERLDQLGIRLYLTSQRFMSHRQQEEKRELTSSA